MTAVWRRRLEASRREFIDQLLAIGFTDATPDGRTSGVTDLRGLVKIPRQTGPDLPHPVIVEVPPDYPFLPPGVRYANPPKTLTWHLQPGGRFCLWHRGNHSRLEWTTAQAVINRIRAWWADRNNAWPHDAGALDLRHYFDASSDMLFTYTSSSELTGPVTVSQRGKDWHHWEPWMPTGGRDEQFKKRVLRAHVAEAVDIGMLDQPVWDWPTIAARIDTKVAKNLESKIRHKGHAFVLLRYRRPGPDGDREGILGTSVTYKEETFQVLAVDTAEDSPEVLTHRAGPDAAVLRTKSALIVGVGAVGSFVADELARSGIGRLTLVDVDRMRPGNSTRHLCGPRTVHEYKTSAVRAALVAQTSMSEDAITTHNARFTPDLALKYMPDHDLVVDATADYSVEWILRTLGNDLDLPVVHTGIHRHGDLVRIDRVSRHSDPNSMLDPVPAIDSGPEMIREVGCIDLISPTPPFAVHAAAALTTATVVDTLSGRWELPDSVIHVLRPQPDDPYRTIGAVTESARP